MGRGTTMETPLALLITQRSQVQILPPLQEKVHVRRPARFAGQCLSPSSSCGRMPFKFR